MILSASEQLTYSTVRIECEYQDGTIGTGTGFCYEFLKNKERNVFTPVVITNKHVIEGAVKGYMLFTSATDGNEPKDQEHFRADFNDFENCWIKHPDPDVDLCAVPIGFFYHQANKAGLRLFFRVISHDLLPTLRQIEDFSALEELIMIGYPDDIWDQVNNKPLIRKGVRASHPRFDYCGLKEIVIDMACYPGSSGSPVFIYNENGYSDRRGNIIMGRRIIFLGILYAGAQHQIEGEIQVKKAPIARRQVAISNIPNNLGYIIKAERIYELENMFKLIPGVHPG